MLALTLVGSPPDTPCVYADVSFSPSPVLWVAVAAVILGAVAPWLWVRRSRSARGPSARQAVFSLLGDVTEGSVSYLHTLRLAAEDAYRQAGVADPRQQFDVVEMYEPCT